MSLTSAPISMLPEETISVIISWTCARDACRLASVSKLFCSAADSDIAWEHFLPFDYPTILDRSEDDEERDRLRYLSKKQLCIRLIHQPLLIDGGAKSFQLDKWTGKKCYMIAARDLFICWGGTPEYWEWTPLPSSRFSEVAKLRAVCWLYIRGNMNTRMLSVGTKYAAYLVFKMTDEAYGLEIAKASVAPAGGNIESISSVCFYPRQGRRMACPRGRSDGWLELKLGELFTRGEGEYDGEVEISLSETEVLNWKGGLIVEGIELRPNIE